MIFSTPWLRLKLPRQKESKEVAEFVWNNRTTAQAVFRVKNKFTYT